MAPGTDGGESLESYVGSMFGDLPPSDPPEQDEGDDPSADAAGAPPAEHADPETPDGPEGSDDDVHAGAPPADASPAALDQVADEPDPLAAATALTYTVNGESRTYDGIKILGDLGALIDAKDVPDVIRRLGERDHLFEQDQQRYAQYQALERATTWQIRDAQGNPQTITGAPALLAQRESLARSIALNREFEKITAGEVNPRDAIGVDAEGNVFWRQDWIDAMTERAKFAGDKSAFAEARRFDALSAPPPPPPPSPATFAAPTISDWEAKYAIQGLTPEDRVFLAEQFPLYVTPDRSAVQPAFLELMKRTAASNTSRATAVTQAGDIAKTNAAKLAAAAVGRRPVTPTRPTTRAQPAITSRQQAEQDAWDLQENTLAAGMRAARSGR